MHPDDTSDAAYTKLQVARRALEDEAADLLARVERGDALSPRAFRALKALLTASRQAAAEFRDVVTPHRSTKEAA